MAWPIACYRCGASAGWHGMHGRVFFCGKTVLCEFFVGFGKGKSVIVFNHSQVIAIFLWSVFESSQNGRFVIGFPQY